MARERQPPGPPRSGLWGQARAYGADAPGFLLGLVSEYGDVVRFHLGPIESYLLNRPDYVHRVLVSDHRACPRHLSAKVVRWILGEGLLTLEGEAHRKRRRAVAPAFHTARLEGWADMIVEEARAHCEGSEARERGSTLNVVRSMMQLTLGVVARVLFDQPAGGPRPIYGRMAEVFGMFERVAPPHNLLWSLLPLPRNLRFLWARRSLRRFIDRAIRERIESGVDRGDVLSALVSIGAPLGGPREEAERVSAREIRDELLGFFFAGHETTAIALSWTWHLLARHPEVEAQLHDEVDTVLQGRPATYHDLDRLEFTRRVLSEVMRLYPPAYILERRASEDMRFGEFVVPAGSTIFLSPYAMHRDPRYYPDPDRFDPDRWLPDEISKRPRHSYFPFAAGPHKCVGEPLAWMEATLVLVTLAQRWTLRGVIDGEVRAAPLVTLRPRGSLRMVLSPRTPTRPSAAALAAAHSPAKGTGAS